MQTLVELQPTDSPASGVALLSGVLPQRRAEDRQPYSIQARVGSLDETTGSFFRQPTATQGLEGTKL